MDHEYFMKMAFELAGLGTGHVSPNPLVGAVVVLNHIVIGKGYHQKYGSAHAEVNAINDAINNGYTNLDGCTLYCNLEPCSHLKKQTPPCAPFIVLHKISTVVISNIDPNPLVSGLGVEILRESGIQVITGVLEAEGKTLNEIFFKFITTNLPFVHLKMAQSLDGRVALESGESKYITGPESLKKVHELRQKYDCIMVGRKTVECDNPSLTTRSEEFSQVSHPLRIVVGKLLGLNQEWKILTDEFRNNTMVITTNEDVKNNPEIVNFLEIQGVALLPVRGDAAGYIDFSAMLNSLASLKITSILVEGGPQLATEFLRLNLVDKVSFFIAPVFIGSGKNSILDLGIKNLNDKLELKTMKTVNFGNDFLVEGYLCLQD